MSEGVNERVRYVPAAEGVSKAEQQQQQQEEEEEEEEEEQELLLRHFDQWRGFLKKLRRSVSIGIM